MNLYPFQHVGRDFLAGAPAMYLADEMGIGKSAQAISAASRLGLERVLIVCPAVARINWAREWALWSGRNHTPRPMEKLGDFNHLTPVGPLICSFEFARHNRAALAAIPWQAVIIDEAHLARTATAERTRALFGKGGVCRSSERVWWLSGTPIEHTPLDLWVPLYFAGKTKMTRSAWMERYCVVVPSPNGPRPVGARTENVPELRTLLRASGFFLRRTKEQVGLELPPLSIHQAFVASAIPLEGFDRAQLDAERELIAHSVGDLSTLTLEGLADLQARAQSISTLLRYTGLCKVAPAAELVENALAQTPKVVVFAKHTSVVDALYARLRKFGAVRLDGRDGPGTRQLAVDRFQRDRDVRVFVGQIRAAGAALTLHAADQVLVVETEWDPASLHQAIARCHRIGQARAVTAQVLTLAGDPLDEGVHRLIVRKAGEIKEVLSI